MLQSLFMFTNSFAVAFLILTISLGWRALGFILNRFFLRQSTVLLDVPNLGRPRPPSQRIEGTAVVCGGRFVELVIIGSID